MNFLKDLSELVTANIISQETAENIKNYYSEKNRNSSNKILLVFGILGALLIGLGIILIVAHNWENFSKTTKLIFAFIPLIIGQFLVGYTLLKKYDSAAWKESSATFLFFAIGVNISLIGQIYNLHNELSLFVITWMLIFLPIIYLLKSSTGSLLYIIGITFYACEKGYWAFPTSESINYWILLLIIIPFYYLLYKRNPKSNFFNFHSWFIPLSIIISLGIIANKFNEFLYIAYFSLFALFQIIGKSKFTQSTNSKINAYSFYGSLGTIVILLILSFDSFWNDLQNQNFILAEIIFSPEIITSIVISIAAIILFIKNSKGISLKYLNWIHTTFIIFVLIFLVGIYSSFAVVLINLLTLAIGIFTIRQGANQNHLGILNYGLLIIASLITCRFFDTDLTFITRGIIFIIVGMGFFFANFWILKKRKLNGK